MGKIQKSGLPLRVRSGWGRYCIQVGIYFFCLGLLGACTTSFRFETGVGYSCKKSSQAIEFLGIQRLTVREITNTLQEMTGGTQDFGAQLPGDFHHNGYRQAGQQTVTADFLEQFYRIIEQLTAFNVDSVSVEAENMTFNSGTGAVVGSFWRFTQGSISQLMDFPSSGDYDIRVRAYGEGATLPQILVSVGASSGIATVRARATVPDVVKVRINGVTAGQHTVRIEYQNAGGAGNALAVDHVEARKRDVYTDLREGLVSACNPFAPGANHLLCYDQIVGGLATLAWSRPLQLIELASLRDTGIEAFTEGFGFDDAVMAGVSRALMSPHFLFHIDEHKGRLSNLDLVERLASILWARRPDNALLLQAFTQNLQEDSQFEALVQSMLGDSRFDGLADFLQQYMGLQNLDTTLAAISQSALRETEMFLNFLYQNQLPLEDLLLSDTTFINGELAAHYGFSGVSGSGFQQVSGIPRRKGVLTQASFFLNHRTGAEPSPTVRGKFVTNRVLCEAIPPPPPILGAGVLSGVNPNQPIRMRMQEHSTSPTCAACHRVLDPPGFAFSMFDVEGDYQPTWVAPSGQVWQLDPAGSFADGRSFTDHLGMIQHLAQDPAYKACLAQNLIVYSSGRRDNFSDHCRSKEMTKNLPANETFEGLLLRVLKSRAFREAGEEGA